jgi:hypothetical protein
MAQNRCYLTGADQRSVPACANLQSGRGLVFYLVYFDQVQRTIGQSANSVR